MMIVKHFNLPFSPPEIVEKKGYRGNGSLVQIFSALSGTCQQWQLDPLLNTSEIYQQSSLVELGQQTRINNGGTT